MRVHLRKGTVNLHYDCDILMDQVRAIDNKRLVKRTGKLPKELIEIVKDTLKIVIDVEQSTTAQQQSIAHSRLILHRENICKFNHCKH